MLPSTGNFKGINCPFFDSGLCERPYCHFRHVKKDATNSLEPSGDILEQLVSEAVKKVLQKELLPGPPISTPPHDIVAQVVEKLELQGKPNEPSPADGNGQAQQFQASSAIPSYNPTPIVELNKKRHIPVPYTPSISSKVQRKRHSSTESPLPDKPVPHKLSKPPTETAIPTKQSSKKLEYNPDIDKSKYLGYSPLSSNDQGSASLHSYTPSTIATLKAPVADYVPTGAVVAKATYEPSGVKRQEPEYLPLSENADSSNKSYIPTDKSKLLDFNFEDVLPEFEMLDEILHEHAQTSVDEDSSKKNGERDTKFVHDTYSATVDSENVSPEAFQVSSHCKVAESTSGKHDGLEMNGTVNPNVNVVNGEGRSELYKSDKHTLSNDSVFNKIKDSTTSMLNTLKGDNDVCNEYNAFQSNKSKHTEGMKSKSSKQSFSSHKKPTISQTSIETKEKSLASSSSKQKLKHKDKHKEKDTHNDKSSKSESSKSSSKDSKKHKSTSSHKSKSSSRSKSDKRRRSSTSSKHKSSSRSRNKSSTKECRAKGSNKLSTKDKDLSTSEPDDDGDTLGDSIMIQSESDEDEIEQECLRIFQEYKPSAQSLIKTHVTEELAIQTQDEVPTKKRKAHDGAKNPSHLPIAAKLPKVNPSRMVAERYQIVKDLYEKNKEEEEAIKQDRLQKMICSDNSIMAMRLQKMRELNERSTEPKSTSSSGKIRIAHVPNVDGLLKAKSKVESYTVMRKQLDEIRQRRAAAFQRHEEHVQSTVAQTGPKGARRLAHMPAPQLLEAPIILPEAGMKIPASVRQKSLNLLVKEHLVFFGKEEAYSQATEEEKTIYSRSTNNMSYSSLISSAILRLRKSSNLNSGTSIAMSKGRSQISHSAVLAGRSRGSWSVETGRKDTWVADTPSLYASLLRYALSEEQLQENGFPRKHSSMVGSAVVQLRYNPNEEVVPCARKCTRCSKTYSVDEKGVALVKDKCQYHDKRAYAAFRRGRYDTTRRYTCCDQGLESSGSSGCQEAPSHICCNFQLNNRGFQCTLPPEEADDEVIDHGLYALDCEMVFTHLGIELARVTVVDQERSVVLDTFVRPEGEIIDYATKYSGIHEEDLEGVDMTIQQVQAILLSMCNSKTILIGHSLDSDLRALKLIHDTVVDTSVVYPHHDPPKKKALKTLSSLYLHRAIQQGDGGHDSSEDALAALDLMMLKVKENH